MQNKRILFISQEIAPYLTGENAVLGRNLPQAMQTAGYQVRTFMPRFGAINERRNQLHEVIRLSGANISIDDDDHPLIIKVASMQPSRIQVYFIDNDDYFQKMDTDIDQSGSNRADNDERAIFFTRGTLDTAKKLRWEPGVILCSGWIASLLPIYLKRVYNDEISFKGSRMVYQILPGNLSQPLDSNIFAKIKADGIPTRDLKKYTDLPLDVDLLHRLGADYSHAVIINDPDANPELVEYIKSTGKPVLTYDVASTGEGALTEFLKSL